MSGSTDQRARDIGRALGSLFRLAHRAKSHMGGSEKYDGATFAVLVQLLESGPQRATALADAMHADPSTVSRQIAHLVELGLVERQADPADGRACLLAATDSGAATLDRMRGRRDAFLAQVVRDWSTEDTTRFAQLLGRFVDDMAATLKSSPHPAQPTDSATTTTVLENA